MIIPRGRRIRRFVLARLLILALLPVVCPSGAQATLPEIKHLKHLHLETILVKNGGSAAVIVVPETGFLTNQAQEIVARIHALSGTRLDVISDRTVPEEILESRNVIVLGNMATNHFIRHLYRQWQVILDLTYPGKGGYVVRSLHNPYGTGHNVLFIGGSDDAGVAEATEAFGNLLGKQKSGSLSVGRLMEIRLGEGIHPPQIGAFLPEWQVFSWNDSWRKLSSGGGTGYPPASVFGWNPISIAGVLFYMTGEKEYLECFKQLAMPDPYDPPLPNRTDNAFTDPGDPLVKNDHYRSYLVDRVFDLIEESPLFSDRERLYITNKLLKHQIEYDPKHSFTAANDDRHGLWHLMNIFTGSRYFATYYPNPIWDQRIENVRTSFRSFIGNPTWGCRDSLYWVSTALEPVFEFYFMDGFDDFVKTGTAKHMLNALDVLMSGDEVDDCNKFLSMGLLLRAAHMTGDSRYLWMLQQVGFDLDVFRIGQSYWPSVATNVEPPTDLVGRIGVAPLAKKDHASSGTSVPGEEAFQVLSYRTGLDKRDDYLLLDGFEGLGRHPYQVNTLLRLRMFGGKDILSGYANDLKVMFNGMSSAHVARSAALKRQLATNDLAYIETEVPDMPGSVWQRHILAMKGDGTVVLDRLIPREGGRFDVNLSWQMGSKVQSSGITSRRVLTANGTGFCSADSTYERLSDTSVQTRISRTLGAGEPLVLTNYFFDSSNPKVISSLKSGGYFVSGISSAFVGVGDQRGASYSLAADFCWLEGDRILLVGATKLSVGGIQVLRSDKPVTLLWDLVEGSARVFESAPGTIRLGEVILSVGSGNQVFDRVVPPSDLTPAMTSFLSGLEADLEIQSSQKMYAASVAPDWLPSWETDLGGAITAIERAHGSSKNSFWAVSQNGEKATLARIAKNGTVLGRTHQSGEILSLRPAGSPAQLQAFSVLAGLRDDTLRAYSESGVELWRVRTSLHPSFVIGDRYDAPWFTDPRPPNNMTGVYSILTGDLWGKGKEEIAVGRPCTVEFRALDGKLRGRVPTRWGINTSLGLLEQPGPRGRTSLLLAGKAYTGNPQLSAIGREYQTISDQLFAEIPPDFTQMHAWLQRGLSDLKIVDLDGDGGQEVVYTLSGNWNELRVYEGTGDVRWVKYFGPGKAGETFMSVLELADLDGDGRKEILAGTKMGWLHAFDGEGNLLWQHRFDSGVTCLGTREKGHDVVVGCEDGSVIRLDGFGNQLSAGNMGAAVRAIVHDNAGVVAGSAEGLVRFYPIAN